MPYPELPVQDLGEFAVGEIPGPALHQFLDNDGNPINLTGFTASIEIESRPVTPGLGTGTVAITDIPNGIVSYTWVAADMMIVGFYRLQIWVTKAGSALSSDVFAYEIYAGPQSS